MKIFCFVLHKNYSSWGLEAQVLVERNWWEKPVIFCLPLFKAWFSVWSSNEPSCRVGLLKGCCWAFVYGTSGTLHSFLSSLEGLFKPHSDFSVEVSCA